MFLALFTDPYSDVRYKAGLKLQLPKGSTPSAANVDKIVSEVFDVQPTDDTKTNTQVEKPSPPANSVRTPVAAPPPIPPPPPADPKTVSLGQTPEQVTTALGPPEKVVKLGAKQTYYYKDMKVTFVNSKVSDVQ